jgi:hypothetical protein
VEFDEVSFDELGFDELRLFLYFTYLFLMNVHHMYIHSGRTDFCCLLWQRHLTPRGIRMPVGLLVHGELGHGRDVVVAPVHGDQMSL